MGLWGSILGLCEQRGMVFFSCNNMLDRNIDLQNRDGGGIDGFFLFW